MNSFAESQALDILSRCLERPTDSCRLAQLRLTPEWDSFAHVEIVVEVEELMNVELTRDQVEQLTGFESLVGLIERFGTSD